MREEIKERVKSCGEYIATTGATVRVCAAHFHISKSSVHKDVTERLKEIDPALYKNVQKVLKFNLKERHLRGGNATKLKYQKRRERQSGKGQIKGK